MPETPGTTIQARIEKLGLFGVLPAAALLSQFDSGQISSPDSREKLLELWKKSNLGFSRSGAPSRSFANETNLRPLDSASSETMRTILERLRNYPPFDSHPTALYSVDVNKLVTPQLVVNVDRMSRRGAFKKDASEANLLNLFFEPGGSPETVNRQVIGIGQNGGSVMYTSFDEDIRLHQPPLFRQIPVSETDRRSVSLDSICFPVGGGTPFAWAIKVPIAPGIFRLLLANGIHRAVAAAAAGLDSIPLAVCEFSPLEIPDPFVELPRGLLLELNSNAPMIVDFTNPELALRIQFYRQLRTVRFNWNFEQYAVALK
jgi:hypothetical protein